MSFPTLTEVYEQTRWKCGDTEVSGGQIYTNALLLPNIQEAARALWRGLRNLAVPRVKRTFYYTLPANTAVFYPSTAGITDFAEPAAPVAYRGGTTSVAISGATSVATGLQVTTSAAHGLTTGDTVTLEQIGGLNGANILCSVTVSSSTVFIANGVVTTGTYTSGGYVTTSANEFTDLVWAVSLPSSTTHSAQGLNTCAYSENRFQFLPSTTAQQIRVTYWSSAQIPTSGSDQIGFNDCIDFISTYAAAEASRSQGARDNWSILREQAVGPDFSRGVIGGELRQLMLTAVRQMQNLSPYERGPRPFREQTDNNYI